MFGYFLVRKTRRKQVVRGSRKLKGRWKIKSRSLVACVAGEILWWAGDTRGGMVLGREGPTVQIGGNIGGWYSMFSA